MTLLSLGLLILLGCAMAGLVARWRLPAITGYLLVGVALGPSAFRLIGPEFLAALQPLTISCLAIIFFLLGEGFGWPELRRMGGRMVTITVAQSLATFLAVLGLALWAGAPMEMALLLGAIAGTTDPAATLAVVREHGRDGELPRALLAVVALSGLVGTLLFTLLLPLVEWAHRGIPASGLAGLWRPVLLELGGSALLGVLLAAGLVGATRLMRREAPPLAITLGLLLLGTGLGQHLHLSVLLIMLIFGSVHASWSPARLGTLDLGALVEGALVVVFFTLAGATLHLAALPQLGALGAAYVVGRVAGKVGGATLGAVLTRSSPVLRRYLGVGLISQGAMAIGLAYVVQDRFPELAGSVLPVCLGAVVIFEAVGPLLTRWSLGRAPQELAAVVPAAAPEVARRP